MNGSTVPSAASIRRLYFTFYANRSAAGLMIPRVQNGEGKSGSGRPTDGIRLLCFQHRRDFNAIRTDYAVLSEPLNPTSKDPYM